MRIGDKVKIEGLGALNPFEGLEGEINWFDPFQEDLGDEQPITVKVNFPVEDGSREVLQNFDKRNIVMREELKESLDEGIDSVKANLEKYFKNKGYELEFKGEADRDVYYDLFGSYPEDDSDVPLSKKACYYEIKNKPFHILVEPRLITLVDDQGEAENYEIPFDFESMFEFVDENSKMPWHFTVEGCFDLDGDDWESFEGFDTEEEAKAFVDKGGNGEYYKYRVTVVCDEEWYEDELEDALGYYNFEIVYEPDKIWEIKESLKEDSHIETIELPHEEYTTKEDIIRINDELDKKAKAGKLIGIRQTKDYLQLAEPEINGIWTIYLDENGYITKITVW